MKMLITVLLVLVSTTIFAQEEEVSNIEEIATTYYNALYSEDFEKVRELSSPDLVFEDPTSPLSGSP